MSFEEKYEGRNFHLYQNVDFSIKQIHYAILMDNAHIFDYFAGLDEI